MELRFQTIAKNNLVYLTFFLLNSLLKKLLNRIFTNNTKHNSLKYG